LVFLPGAECKSSLETPTFGDIYHVTGTARGRGTLLGHAHGGPAPPAAGCHLGCSNSPVKPRAGWEQGVMSWGPGVLPAFPVLPSQPWARGGGTGHVPGAQPPAAPLSPAPLCPQESSACPTPRSGSPSKPGTTSPGGRAASSTTAVGPLTPQHPPPSAPGPSGASAKPWEPPPCRHPGAWLDLSAVPVPRPSGHLPVWLHRAVRSQLQGDAGDHGDGG